MKIRPAHHALLCYAEWCCDNGRPWPKMKMVAADLARDERDLRQAFGELMEWGLVSIRYCRPGQQRILRLGDGRETAAPSNPRYPQPLGGIRLVFQQKPALGSRNILDEETRAAA